MCGIGGFQLSRQSADFDPSCMLGEIQKKLRHRGRDGEGCWVNDQKNIGFCHTRLAILDLTQMGLQPMKTSDGRYMITFNGEIYNWRILRQQLEDLGETFYSNSDTEVILYGYKRWGSEVIQKLRGMFAFAIWDHVEKILFCARDRVGKKPFIYSESSKGFFFASEIPALKVIAQQAGLDLAQDYSALAAMLLHNLRHIPEPATAYKGLKKLRAGHAIHVRNGRIEKYWRYWNPASKDIHEPQELRNILEEATAIRSSADVPIAALLSGGVDSTAIVSLMQKQLKKPVRTYAFGVDRNDEDLRRARFVSKKLGTWHKEFYFDARRQHKIMQQIVTIYGEPIMLLPLIHAYELSEAIRDDGIKVVMNGNGADELFFGYTGHLHTAHITHLFHWLGWVARLLPHTTRPVLSVFQAEPGKRKSTLYQRKAESCWPNYLKQEAIGQVENLVSEEMEYWGRILPNQDFIDESNYLSLLIENSHSVTIASDLPAMMASVEMRSPFLDQEVISAAMGIHYSQKVKGPKDGSRLKNILRKAVYDLVPEQVMHAPKRGFGMGIQERDVLLNDWRYQVDKLFNDYPESDLFDRDKIRRQWKNARNGESVQWSEIAKLFAIGMWLRGDAS